MIKKWWELLLFVGLWRGLAGAEQPLLIPGDEEYGSWDAGTRTYTLTRDVVGEVYVGEDSLVLDGAGHAVRSRERGSGQGIVLEGRRGVVVRNLVVGDFARQVLLRGAHGNLIVRNRIGGDQFEHGHGRGIYLQESDGNTIAYNAIVEHGGGVSLESSSENIFTNNRIAHSSKVAVHIFGQSEKNRFVRNVFSANRRQIDISAYSKDNIFSAARPIGGNYWDRCVEPDDNGDRFVDTTFTFAGGEDVLPWIAPQVWPRETLAARGSDAVLRALPGAEVVLFKVGLVGDGYERLHAVTIHIEDLSHPTGLNGEDLRELRLYRSRDGTLSGVEYRLGTLGWGAMRIGSPSTIAAARIERPPAGKEVFYLVTAVLGKKVTDGHALKVAFASGGVEMDGMRLGTEVRACEACRVVVDVRATRLVFQLQPDGAFSGMPLRTQPVVVALDEHGNLDRDFNGGVTLSLAGMGSLGMRARAESGVARFSGVIYNALRDGEAFRLVADDEGEGGVDLPPVVSKVVRVRR